MPLVRDMTEESECLWRITVHCLLPLLSVLPDYTQTKNKSSLWIHVRFVILYEGAQLSDFTGAGDSDRKIDVWWTWFACSSSTTYPASSPSEAAESCCGFAATSLASTDTAATASSRPPQVASVTCRAPVQIERQPRFVCPSSWWTSSGTCREDVEESYQRRTWF